MKETTKEIIKRICSHWICADDEELDRVSKELDELTAEKDKEIEVERQTLKALIKKGTDRWNALQAELQQIKEENERLKNDQMLICDRYTIKNHPDLPNGSKVIWIENEQGEGMTVDINKLFNDSF